MESDKEIWDNFRKGDRNALSYIYHNHIQMLFRYGKKFSHDDELIKDIIQELFYDLIRTRKNLGKTDNISFYLMASLRRKLAKIGSDKNQVSYESRENKLEADIVYSAEADLIGKEEVTHRERIVQNALAELSPRQREILFYRFNCGFDYDQICEIMSLQYDSARKQVSRALKALKEILSDAQLFLLFILGLNKSSYVQETNFYHSKLKETCG